jgi:hypothetical protein
LKVIFILFFILIFVIGFIIGYNQGGDLLYGDLLSSKVNKKLRLEQEIVVLNGENNHLTIPSGTFLLHYSSNKWNDTLLMTIVVENGIIEEITSSVPENVAISYYQQTPTLSDIISSRRMR